MENNARQMTLVVLVSLLKQAKCIDKISFLITITGLVIFIGILLTYSSQIILIVSLAIFLVGVIEKYYAFRVGFDKALFKGLLLYKEIDLPVALSLLDNALLNLKLIKSKGQQTRDLLSRQQGVLLLLKKQLCCCIVQIILLFSIPFIF